MGVGRCLKKILRDRKMTIKQLSIEANIPLNTLYSITKRDSERVDSVILQEIANALEIPVGELTGLSEVDAFWAEFDESTQINRYLDDLNEDGRKEAVKRVAELTEIPRYKKQAAEPFEEKK